MSENYIISDYFAGHSHSPARRLACTLLVAAALWLGATASAMAGSQSFGMRVLIRAPVRVQVTAAAVATAAGPALVLATPAGTSAEVLPSAPGAASTFALGTPRRTPAGEQAQSLRVLGRAPAPGGTVVTILLQ